MILDPFKVTGSRVSAFQLIYHVLLLFSESYEFDEPVP